MTFQIFMPLNILYFTQNLFPSVQFSHSVVSNSLWPHGLQHTRPLCPTPTPGAYSNSCPSSRWCHPTISSSVIPFSSHLQSFPASGSFQLSQLFTSGGQSIRVSALASVLPMNIQDWFPLGIFRTDFLSLNLSGKFLLIYLENSYYFLRKYNSDFPLRRLFSLCAFSPFE